MNKTLHTPKGLPLAVLKAIASLGSDACGVEVAKVINGNTDRDISTAQVYMTLRRLNAKGLLVEKRRTKVNERGAPRRIYAVTGDGKRALEAGMRLYGVGSQ